MLPEFWAQVGLLPGMEPKLECSSLFPCSEPKFLQPTAALPTQPRPEPRRWRPGRWASGRSVVMAAITKASPCPQMALCPALL